MLDQYTIDTKFPKLITPINSSNSQFFTMSFHVKPLSNPDVDYSVAMEMNPLHITYNMPLLERIGIFLFDIEK